MSQHSTRASPALQALAEQDPAIAALSLWCIHRDGPRTQTTGDVISYGPDFENLARHEQIGLAAHHVLHVALRHPARLADFEARLGAGFDAELYNLAADALVNEALLLADHALPRPAVTLQDLLAARFDIETTPEAALAEWDVDRLYFALASPSDKSRRQSNREFGKKQGFQADLKPQQGTAKPKNPTEDTARWAQHTARAMDAGRRAGRGLGRIGHRIADIAQPRTPWELILRAQLSTALMRQPQPSPHRPSRRWLASVAEANRTHQPVPGFQPGVRPFSNVARIALALDASSSIDAARLALFWSEITGIARRMCAELHVMVFDDAVRSCTRVDPSQQNLTLPDMPRGGGTQFAPVLAQAGALEAAALVVFTDLDGDAGAPPKGLKVIWAVPDGRVQTPPYGTLIDLSA
ncbi:MAG: VWA-like domain-containing protein [Sedimentitalea sp.]